MAKKVVPYEIDDHCIMDLKEVAYVKKAEYEDGNYFTIITRAGAMIDTKNFDSPVKLDLEYNRIRSAIKLL